MLIHHLKSANVICKNLNSLYLSNNSIDDEGVIALTECLPELFPSIFLWLQTTLQLEMLKAGECIITDYIIVIL